MESKCVQKNIFRILKKLKGWGKQYLHKLYSSYVMNNKLYLYSGLTLKRENQEGEKNFSHVTNKKIQLVFMITTCQIKG